MGLLFSMQKCWTKQSLYYYLQGYLLLKEESSTSPLRGIVCNLISISSSNTLIHFNDKPTSVSITLCFLGQLWLHYRLTFTSTYCYTPQICVTCFTRRSKLKWKPTYLHLFTEASIVYRLTFWSVSLSVPMVNVKHGNTCFLCSCIWSLNYLENLLCIPSE